MNRVKQWLKYYRASLIDGAVDPKNNIFESNVVRQHTSLEQLESSEIEGLQCICNKQLFLVKDKDGDKEVEWADIQIAPIFITNEFEHTKSRNDNAVGRHYPFWITARVNKEGMLRPPAEIGVPVFMRPYLSPNPKDLPTIAEMDKVDSVLSQTTIDCHDDSWPEYWASCEEYFQGVTGADFMSYHNDHVRFGLYVYSDKDMTHNIRRLYDQLLDEDCEPENELMRVLLTEKEETQNKELNSEDKTDRCRTIFLNKNHYGQMRCDFPLSRSQRVAFAEYLDGQNNKVFAVNGPPGTGKTTLLQSIVANHVVMPVLDNDEPMLIVGCSTNNQAITNILDSMQSRDTGLESVLTERWLPDVKAFGLYLSTSQNNRSEQQGYQQVMSKSLDDGFAKEIDQRDRATEFEAYFIEKATLLLRLKPDVKLTEVKKILRDKIDATKHTIDVIIDKVAAYVTIPEWLESLGFENEESLEANISEVQHAINLGEDFRVRLNRIGHELVECYEKLPFVIKYFPFGFCKKYRSNKFQLIIDPIAEHIASDLLLHKYFHLIAEVDRLKLVSSKKQAEEMEKLKQLTALSDDLLGRKESYRTAFDLWKEEHHTRWAEVIKRAPNYNDLPSDEITAAKLDISLRHDLFWLCVHYREVEYIELVSRKITGRPERQLVDCEKKLRRLACITPLFIATFHSLPRFSTHYERRRGDVFYRDLYDLMIVDEAGQVAPEMAVASFALTKRIVAVGDVKQIEPVAGVTDRIDFVNAQKYGLLTTGEQFNDLSALGFMASECSLMQLVKKSCPYKFTFHNGLTDKGVYLLEHYRCLDHIIRYSNDYVYNGCLDLQGGVAHHKNHSLPPMGYIHVNGCDEQINGSRQNDLEARVIAEWLFNHYKSLEEAYKKNIGEVLAIIAPFAVQVRLIRKYVREFLGERVSAKLTIGTVHTLQGADREVILFSSVYGQHNSSMFFDRRNKYNMLNVAVTRAKHTFIVFGNMQIFQPQLSTPSGDLAKVLFSKESYNLDQNFIYSSERIYTNTKAYDVIRISTLDKHRSCLGYCFREAKKRLLIFSPFISKVAIVADGIPDLITEAVNKGVSVEVVTDQYLDRVDGRLKSTAESGRRALREAGAKLIVYKGVHSKTICIDDRWLIEGSFNWFSAVRDETSPYCRKEASVMMQGEGIAEMIRTIVSDFKLDEV